MEADSHLSLDEKQWSHCGDISRSASSVTVHSERKSDTVELLEHAPSAPPEDVPSTGEGVPPPAEIHHGRHQKISPLLWYGEILSLVVGLLLMVAIVVTLAKADAKPPPSWALGITLNTLLAFLVSVARIAFMYPVVEGMAQLKWIWFSSSRPKPLIDFQVFDDASRGPWGCIKLLFQMRGPIACLGALIAISGIITSTLTQQAISYDQLPAILEAGNATIPRATTFSLYRDGDLHLEPWEMVRGKQSLLNGALHIPNDTFPHVTPECPSGNCEWEPYGSLAICSEVVNLTAMGNATLLSDIRETAYTRAGALFNSSSMFMNDGIFFNSFPMAELPPLFPALVGTLTKSTGIFNESVYQAMIGDYYLAYTDDMITSSTVYTSDFHFIEIAIYWCTKTYSVRVQDGTPAATELGTATGVITPDPHTLNFIWSLDFGLCYLTGNCNETLGAMEIELEPPPNVASTVRYNINVWTSLIGSILIGSTMYDSILMDATRGIITSTGGGVAQAFASSIFGDFLSTESPPMEVQMQNIRGVVSNIARGLTNHVQDGDTRFAGAGNAALSAFAGTVFTPQTFVKIHWRYMGVLCAQIVLTIAFLAGTVFATYRSGAQIFKGSSLAALSALNEETRQYLGQASDAKSMSERARRINVRMEKGGPGGGHWLTAVTSNPVSSWQPVPSWSSRENAINRAEVDSLYEVDRHTDNPSH